MIVQAVHILLNENQSKQHAARHCADAKRDRAARAHIGVDAVTESAGEKEADLKREKAIDET